MFIFKRILFLIIMIVSYGVYRYNQWPDLDNKTTPLPAQSPEVDNVQNIMLVNRVTKKPFGIYITKENSPVSPERFNGYHTGTDFEAYEAELDSVVKVYAICSGQLLVKSSTSGYGGYTVQECTIDNNPVTVVYGHIKLSSIEQKVGDNLATGDVIGILGKGYSSETDNERKHLHLGIHKGSSINIKGYVQNKEELSAWLDAEVLLNDGKISYPL